MRVLLLLVLSLAVPFRTFTTASPTELPESYHEASSIPDTSAPATLEVVTGMPPTEPATAEHGPEVTSEVPMVETEAQTQGVVTTEQAIDTTEAPTVEPSTMPAGPGVTEQETAAMVTTGAAATKATAPDGAELERSGIVEESTDTVVVEEPASDGLSTGQVVGIVIGALLAVIILIAVLISVFRRMGKYTP